MCEPTIKYQPGTRVWSKVLNWIWWPGKIVNLSDTPEEFREYVAMKKKNCIAVVYYDTDKTYDAVTNINKIMEYNCPSKMEFLEKGYAYYEKEKKKGSKIKGDIKMENFIKDVLLVEREIGGDDNIFGPISKKMEKNLNKELNFRMTMKELFVTSKNASQKNTNKRKFLGEASQTPIISPKKGKNGSKSVVNKEIVLNYKREDDNNQNESLEMNTSAVAETSFAISSSSTIFDFNDDDYNFEPYKNLRRMKNTSSLLENSESTLNKITKPQESSCGVSDKSKLDSLITVDNENIAVLEDKNDETIIIEKQNTDNNLNQNDIIPTAAKVQDEVEKEDKNDETIVIGKQNTDDNLNHNDLISTAAKVQDEVEKEDKNDETIVIEKQNTDDNLNHNDLISAAAKVQDEIEKEDKNGETIVIEKQNTDNNLNQNDLISTAAKVQDEVDLVEKEVVKSINCLQKDDLPIPDWVKESNWDTLAPGFDKAIKSLALTPDYKDLDLVFPTEPEIENEFKGNFLKINLPKDDEPQPHPYRGIEVPDTPLEPCLTDEDLLQNPLFKRAIENIEFDQTESMFVFTPDTFKL